MSYRIKRSSSFKKDYKKIQHQHELVKKLKEVITLLAAGTKLPPQYRDHALKGKYTGLRDCHVTPDLVLIYEIRDQELILSLIRLGSHSHVF